MYKHLVISLLVSLISFSAWTQETSQKQVEQSTTSSSDEAAVAVKQNTPETISTQTQVPTQAPVLTQAPVAAPIAAPIVAPQLTPKFTVKQIIKSHNLVVVESNVPVDFKEGKVFLVTFDDGKQCSLVLKDTAKTLLTFDASECERSSYITLASPVEPSLASIPIATERSTPRDSRSRSSSSFGKRFSANLYYSVADKATFEDAKVTTTGASGSVNATYGTDSSVGLGVGYLRTEQQSWGFSGSILYEPRREIKSLTVSGPGGTFTSSATGTKAKLSFILLEANAIYRWNEFYIPFGLNLSAPSLTDTGSDVYDVKGGLGAFLGAGWFIMDNSSIELFVRSIGMKMTATDGTTTIDFQNGYMTGAGFGWKYYF